MDKKIILVVEDDLSILIGLEDNLKLEDYEVITASNGHDGLKFASEKEIDLILLDIMLPGVNGYEICRKIKKEKPDLPIIMLTARSSEIDKISGLDYGADDYITKPFSIPELLARIRAVLRRTGKKSGSLDQYSFGNVKLDFKNFKAFFNAKEVRLSPKEFEIMKYFIHHEEEVIHRDELLDEVWGYDVLPTTRTVDNFILDLRKKLEENPSNPRHIVSIRGVGYKFVS